MAQRFIKDRQRAITPCHIHSGVRRILMMSAFCFSTLPQPAAFAVHFEDVDVVGYTNPPRH